MCYVWHPRWRGAQLAELAASLMAPATSGIRTASARMLCVLAVTAVAFAIHLTRCGQVSVPAGQLPEEAKLQAAAAETDEADLVRRPAPQPEHAATGKLLWSDGVEPVVGCAYGRISDPSEPV